MTFRAEPYPYQKDGKEARWQAWVRLARERIMAHLVAVERNGANHKELRKFVGLRGRDAPVKYLEAFNRLRREGFVLEYGDRIYLSEFYPARKQVPHDREKAGGSS